jgi:hypothetical protein
LIRRQSNHRAGKKRHRQRDRANHAHSLSQNSLGGTRCPQRVGHVASPSIMCAFGDSCPIVLRSRLRSELRRAKQNDPPKFVNFLLFIRRFPSVEDGPGGTYLSGQSSNPAHRRHLRIDRSTRVGRSFSEFRTCCVGESCVSSIRESRRTEECTALGKTRNLGG